MRESTRTLNATLVVRLHLPNGSCFGPEELALLDKIRSERSIHAASRALGVSYRKCWQRVDALNRTFEQPIVATFPGRNAKGSEITAFGERVTALYRSILRSTSNSSNVPLSEMTECLDWSFAANVGVEPAVQHVQ